MSVEIDMVGLDRLKAYFKDAGDRLDRAEVMAVSNASRFARSESSKEIRSTVNFTVSYLNKDDRLEVKRNHGGREATLTGRHRATSLANPIFNKTTPRYGRPKKGFKVRVQVARKGGYTFENAFFVPLRSGNVGLAVRTPDGRPPSAGAKPIFGGAAHLMYGPSVGQIAFDVFPAIAGDLSEKLATEFIRQVERGR